MYFIDRLSIENFKSFRDFQLAQLKRINVFIGRPNGGKSNLLQALSLFSRLWPTHISIKKINQLIRLERPAKLFYLGNVDRNITIHTNLCGWCFK